jgi:hypothetical protein
MQGIDVSLEVRAIQKELEEWRQAEREGKLKKEYDWDADLRMAESFHARRIAWMERDIRAREDWRTFWQSRISENSDFVRRMAQDGIKFILLAHGAIAVAALSALTSASSDRYKNALVCAMFGAAIGLALVAGGKIAIIESVSTFNENIKGRLINKRGWLSIQAFSRYGDIYFQKYARWAVRLIYGSLVWCSIYIFFCLMLLASS